MLRADSSDVVGSAIRRYALLGNVYIIASCSEVEQNMVAQSHIGLSRVRSPIGSRTRTEERLRRSRQGGEE